MDNIYSAYHYACKTKADRDAIEELAPKVLEAADKAAFGNIGDIQYTARTTAPIGGEWCDGATYTKDKYPVLYDMLVSGKLQYVDIATYNSVVELNGVCGLFGLDVANKSFRVPTVKALLLNKEEAAVVGNGMSLGLTDGSSNISFSASHVGYINFKTGGYGTNVGLGNGGSDIAAGKTIGVTTDPDKSGIVANLDVIEYRAYVILYTGKDISFDKKEEYKLNNPFSLLDYKWSEYAIANSSWLISNGSFHSGAVYKSAYELLMKIYNGAEVKDGVSVKLSTEEHTDYDFVVNTADMTFRLPMKVKLASGSAVVGNGMTLGMTNGVDYLTGLTICIDGDPGHRGRLGQLTGAYGQELPYYGGMTNTDGKALGVTTDPEKSGIETSSQGLKLYFYVGDTVQDPSVIDASKILEMLANIDYVVESKVATDADPTWYRVYKSGWVEQGGSVLNATSAATTIVLPKTFSNLNYKVSATSREIGSWDSGDFYITVYDRSNKSIAVTTRIKNFDWEAKGQGA